MKVVRFCAFSGRFASGMDVYLYVYSNVVVPSTRRPLRGRHKRSVPPHGLYRSLTAVNWIKRPWNYSGSYRRQCLQCF